MGLESSTHGHARACPVPCARGRKHRAATCTKGAAEDAGTCAAQCSAARHTARDRSWKPPSRPRGRRGSNPVRRAPGERHWSGSDNGATGQRQWCPDETARATWSACVAVWYHGVAAVLSHHGAGRRTGCAPDVPVAQAQHPGAQSRNESATNVLGTVSHQPQPSKHPRNPAGSCGCCCDFVPGRSTTGTTVEPAQQLCCPQVQRYTPTPHLGEQKSDSAPVRRSPNHRCIEIRCTFLFSLGRRSRASVQALSRPKGIHASQRPWQRPPASPRATHTLQMEPCSTTVATASHRALQQLFHLPPGA